MKNVHVQVVSPATAKKLRGRLEADGFEIGTAPHALFEARAKNVRVTAYASGKLLIQGKGTDAVLQVVSSLLGDSSDAAAGELCESTIGSDESGKGDFFGSLVVAACHVSPADVPWVRGLGVRDSKQASAPEIRAAALELEKRLPFAVVELEPAEYNRQHEADRNVNVLLGRAHARAIAELLGRTDARRVIVDRFGGEHYVRDALGPAAQGITLIQVPRAEEHPAVAAASFIARARFVQSLERLSAVAGKRLLPGASAAVDRRAREIVRERGRDILPQIAKVHFKTMERVLR